MQKAPDFASLYIDFDSYFASAEQNLRPELRGRPVGVVPLQSRHTCLIAASREAKRFGLKTGTPVIEALEKCPGIALVAARHDAYVKLRHQIIDVVDTIVPIQDVCSIDEVHCQLLANERARAREIAEAIKLALAREIGPVLTCSIGVAPNELLAKIAAEMEKPDGLVALHGKTLLEQLTKLKLTDIPGIGQGNARRLGEAGITTVEALWALPSPQLRAIWGGVQGERFWAFLHGFDIQRQGTQRSMFGHSRVLGWDQRAPDQTETCARLLLVKAMRRMRRDGFAASVLGLGLRSETGAHWNSERRSQAFRDDHAALAGLSDLFCRARAADAIGRTKKVQVTLHGLVPVNQVQLDLLETEDARCAREKWERLSDLTDALQARYKKPILTLGPHYDPPGGYAGAKIAFGRIPALADF